MAARAAVTTSDRTSTIHTMSTRATHTAEPPGQRVQRVQIALGAAERERASAKRVPLVVSGHEILLHGACRDCAG